MEGRIKSCSQSLRGKRLFSLTWMAHISQSITSTIYIRLPAMISLRNSLLGTWPKKIKKISNYISETAVGKFVHNIIPLKKTSFKKFNLWKFKNQKIVLTNLTEQFQQKISFWNNSRRFVGKTRTLLIDRTLSEWYFLLFMATFMYVAGNLRRPVIQICEDKLQFRIDYS